MFGRRDAADTAAGEADGPAGGASSRLLMRRRRKPQSLRLNGRPQPARTGIESLAGASHPPGVRFKRFYEPDSLRVMTDALDFACAMLPKDIRESESLRRRLALRIMHDLDAGERDPARLATAAVLSLRI